MDRAQVRGIMSGFKGKRVLVVGDLMLDRYVYGTVSRISPEAPVPVVEVRSEKLSPGGAANVALNVQTLGGQAVMAGFLGTDSAGGDLAGLLESQGILLDGVLRNPEVTTTVKMRILAERQQVCRVDYEEPERVTDNLAAALLQRLEQLIPTVDGVVIEDYGKGVISQAVVDTVLNAAESRGIPIGLDPKNPDLRFRRLTLATPNYSEACGAAGVPMSTLGDHPEENADLVRAGEILQRKWNCDFLMITLGPKGMYLVSKGGPAVVIPTKAREVYDVSGAGDTVIAATMLALVAGADKFAAAALGNYAAGVVVGKVGTVPCHAQELLDAVP